MNRIGSGQGSSAGFSLIEVVAAMALALLLLVGTAELITVSIWARRKGDTTAALTQALTTRVESLKSLASSPEGLVPGEYSELVRDEAGRGLYLHEWTVEDAGERMTKIRVAVRPAGRPGPGTALVLWVSKDLRFGP